MRIMNKIFNSVALRRVLVIFVFGLVTRVLVNHVYDINVFKEYTNVISLTYYGFMAYFSVFICDVSLPKISLNVFNLSIIRDAVRNLIGSDFMGSKMTLGGMEDNPSKVGSREQIDKSLVHLNRRGGYTPSEKTIRYGRGDRNVGLVVYGQNSTQGKNGIVDVVIHGKEISLIQAKDDHVTIKGSKEGVFVRKYKDGVGYREIYFKRGDAVYRFPAWLEDKYNKENGWYRHRTGLDTPTRRSSSSLSETSIVQNNVEFNTINKFKCRLLWSVWQQFTGDFSSYRQYCEYHTNGKVSIRDELKRGFNRR